MKDPVFQMPAMIFDSRFRLLVEVTSRMTASVNLSAERPGPDVRPEFLALVEGLETEKDCGRAYFFLHDWATEIEKLARRCSDRQMALRAVESVDDPRR